ncbi:sugar phosphate isomerase/epimerase family protein [Flavobacterium foetidum]|uniref:sugar phosphate isomerase/epimerase family protein n=1 Tax=Flavobacterium foetidum TaxID=2026681 RepID=UPI001074E362|nr:sugar phosphate isomerase/epimerase [Flavobacterium foetidum]KAF2516556.1 sugar phosphate isomerase/epimerase [Flavobacterium foetidum]
MISRRTFMINSALATVGILAMPSMAFNSRKRDIGLQLYTLRSELAKDVKTVLEKVSKAGFATVETYGFSVNNQFWGLAPAELKKMLDANGLKAISGHYNCGSFLADGNLSELKASIEAAKTLKSKYFTIPWVDEPFRKNLQDYKIIASRLNLAAASCRESGLQLAYHNHDFEFQKHDGITGYEILLDETDKDSVCFELDLYWVVRSGNDPIKLFKENPGRFKLWHVKDMDKNNPALNTEVGNGSIDFKSIFKEAALSGMEHYFVEQENNFAVDSFQSIKSSNDFCSNNFDKL